MVAIYFLLIGAWFIIIFTCIEILALTVALYVYTKHALDYEKITVLDKRLLVEKSWGGKVTVDEFNTIWTKLERKEDGRGKLVLKNSTQELSIGYFVRGHEQLQFEKELSRYLGK